MRVQEQLVRLVARARAKPPLWPGLEAAILQFDTDTSRDLVGRRAGVVHRARQRLDSALH